MTPTQFRSNRDNLLLTIRPARITAGGTAYESGSRVQFRNGEFATGDRKVIAFLRSHELLGLEERGFWEESASEPEPSKKRPQRAKSKRTPAPKKQAKRKR